MQALQLLHGNNAVLPALRAAAEQYHAQRSAPIDELSRLLAHVSIAAEQVREGRGRDNGAQQSRCWGWWWGVWVADLEWRCPSAWQNDNAFEQESLCTPACIAVRTWGWVVALWYDKVMSYDMP